MELDYVRIVGKPYRGITSGLHSLIDAPDSGNAPRGGEVHIYCYRLLASLGQVHAYQTTSSDNMISIKPYMV